MTRWVAIAHGSSRDEPKVIDVITMDPRDWCEKMYQGTFYYTSEYPYDTDEYNVPWFELNLPNTCVSFEVDGKKYAKFFGLQYIFDTIYITCVEKKTNTILEIVKAFSACC
jgi:hypothetical protein